MSFKDGKPISGLAKTVRAVEANGQNQIGFESRLKVCAANWKLNKSPKESLKFIESLNALGTPEELRHLWIFPPATSWSVFSEHPGLCWGGQNVHTQSHGAFTGENSLGVLAEMGGQCLLVGHSERRHFFGETIADTKIKVIEALKQNLTPILCVGETLKERESGQTGQVLEEQLRPFLSLSDAGDRDAETTKKLCQFKNWLVAYEPVWAIGTGLVATLEQVDEAHKFIQDLFKKKADRPEPHLLENASSDRVSGTAREEPSSQTWLKTEAPGTIRVLYGGSVKIDNIASLSQLESVSGFLIGGASLTPESLLGCLRNTALTKQQ